MQPELFIRPMHNMNSACHPALMEDVASVVLAEKLGFDEFWCGEILSPIPDVKESYVIYGEVRDSFVMNGSAETATRKIRPVRDEVGPFGTLLMTARACRYKADMHRSVELVATNLMHAVNTDLESRPVPLTA